MPGRRGRLGAVIAGGARRPHLGRGGVVRELPAARRRHVTFKANDIAPGKSRHWDEKNWISVGNNGSRYVDNYSTNVVLEGNAIHGFTQEECADMGCHVECLTLEAENITVRANRIWDCDIYGSCS